MKRLFSALLLTVLTSAALAHDLPGAHVHGFGAGLLHPLLGVDHLLAIVALGLWAALLEGHLRLVLPAVFAAGMALGGWAGMEGFALPYVETGIALSVLIFGLMLASFVADVRMAFALAALFALFHGNAHGVEMPLAASALLYTLGYVTMTLLLGYGAMLAGTIARRAAILRVAGGAAAALGALWSLG